MPSDSTQPQPAASAAAAAALAKPRAGGRRPPPKKPSAMMTAAMVGVFLLVAASAIVTTILLITDDSKTPGTTPPVATRGDPIAGKNVTIKYGCITCHSDDGSQNRGPTYKGLFGSVVTYEDGSTGIVDEKDVRYALTNPTGKIIAGFEGIMPKTTGISEEEIVNLVAYLRSIGVGK